MRIQQPRDFNSYEVMVDLQYMKTARVGGEGYSFAIAALCKVFYCSYKSNSDMFLKKLNEAF